MKKYEMSYDKKRLFKSECLIKSRESTETQSKDEFSKIIFRSVIVKRSEIRLKPESLHPCEKAFVPFRSLILN